MLKEIQNKYDVDIDYPLAQFIMCSGFFLILTIEQAVLQIQESWIQSQEESEPLLSGGVNTSYQSNHHHHHHHHHHDHQHPVISGVSTEVHHQHDGHGHHHSHMSHSMFQHSSLRSIMLLLALSFHSVFEGKTCAKNSMTFTSAGKYFQSITSTCPIYPKIFFIKIMYVNIIFGIVSSESS